MSTNKKICPDCTEVSKEQCDPLCREVHSTDCIVHEGAISCLGIAEGSSTTLSEILPLICGISGGGLAVEQTEASIEDCPNGGTTITIGLDNNGDNIIDVALVTFNVCNGAPGEDGESQTISVTNVPPSAPFTPCTGVGGILVDVDGFGWYICNGAPGQDGQDCTNELEGIDFSCLADYGVNLTGDLVSDFNSLINTVCCLLENSTACSGGSGPIIQDISIDICYGETFQVNLLENALGVDIVDSIEFTDPVPFGNVLYNPSTLDVCAGGCTIDICGNPSAQNCIEVTATSDMASIQTRGFRVTTPQGFADAILTITVVGECPAPPVFWEEPQAICFSRKGFDQEISWAYPINEEVMFMTGSQLTISSSGGNCGSVASGCPCYGVVGSHGFNIILNIQSDGELIIDNSSYWHVFGGSPQPLTVPSSIVGNIYEGTFKFDPSIHSDWVLEGNPCTKEPCIPSNICNWEGNVITFTLDAMYMSLGETVNIEQFCSLPKTTGTWNESTEQNSEPCCFPGGNE